MVKRLGQAAVSLIISAQTNPASSRAMAVTTTARTFLRTAMLRKRAHSRCCAVQDRAIVAAGTPACDCFRRVPMLGRC